MTFASDRSAPKHHRLILAAFMGFCGYTDGLMAPCGFTRPGDLVPLALLLDIDGTLIDTLDVILVAMNVALEEVGEPSLRADELRPFIGMPVHRQMAILRGMEGAVVDEIADRYYLHFMRRIDEGLRLYPDVKETLEAPRDRPIGTMTTRRRDVARRMHRAVGIDQCFRAIIGGNEVPRLKPHPDLPFHSARVLGLRPAECVVVGDAPVDILAGRKAGMWTVGATYGYGDPEALREAGCHAEIAQFRDLPGVLGEFEGEAARVQSRRLIGHAGVGAILKL